MSDLNFNGVELSILVRNAIEELFDHDRLHHDCDHHASDEELSTKVGVQPLVATASASQIITRVDVNASKQDNNDLDCAQDFEVVTV